MTSMRFLRFKNVRQENWGGGIGVQIDAMLETVFGQVVRVHVDGLAVENFISGSIPSVRAGLRSSQWQLHTQ